MAVLVAGTGRDDGHAGPRRCQQLRRRRRLGAVVTDLEHVDRRNQAALEEQPLDGRLGVPGQQRGEAAVAQERDDRAIVDIAFGQRQARIGFGRVDDLQARGSVEVEDRAGPGQAELG
jgi:hypothetical protein